MKLVFFTDPHLGLARMAHTTPESSARLQARLANQVTALIKEEGWEPDTQIFCLGDLFDTAIVPPNALIQGFQVINSGCHVLAGNHDVVNNVSAYSSLALIDVLSGGKVSPMLGNPTTPDVITLTGYGVVAVPHKYNQSIFEAALQEAKISGLGLKTATKFLLLHCNYESPFELGDSSLNITRQIAADMLEVFDFILIGHEHNPRSDLDGRVKILGNTHPTSFSDISDKFCYTFDTETREWSKRKIWSREQAIVIDVQDLHTLSDSVFEKAEFITVKGEYLIEDSSEIDKAILNLWKRAPNAFMIRKVARPIQDGQVILTGNEDGLTIENILHTVSSQIPEDLRILWEEYYAQVD